MSGWDEITTKKVEEKKPVQVGNVIFPDVETKEKILGSEILGSEKISVIKSTQPPILPKEQISILPKEQISIVRREYDIKPIAIVSEKSAIVMPATSIEGVRKWQKTFNEVKKALIDQEKDVELLEIFNKKKGKVEKIPFIKKSGWRKLATAFNLVDEIVYEEKISEKPNVYTWKIVVRVTAPNGRSSMGVAMCSTKEFTNIRKEHDIYSTAHTRAKNRGISDLIGGGEVSYEEIDSKTIENGQN